MWTFIGVTLAVGIIGFVCLVKADVDADFRDFDKDLHVKHLEDLNKGASK